MRAPAVFFAHGSPMSALGGDAHAWALRDFGQRVTEAKAILVVSAHWQEPSPLRVTSWAHAPLVYDFTGFAEKLYSLTYPAPGLPKLAVRIASLLRAAGQNVRMETTRGLDHGAWVPLRLSWPEATIPVVELSLPEVSPAELFQLGRDLQRLRDDGILIAGSGGIVHNLRRVRLREKLAPSEDWASQFDQWVAAQIDTANWASLFAYAALAPHADLAVPTTEHIDPLFVALGASFPEERVETIFEGFHYGNLSMRSLAFGAPL